MTMLVSYTTLLQSTETQNIEYEYMRCAGWRYHVLRLPVPGGESRIRLYRIPGIPDPA
jgi:hypothetical protein